MGTGGTWWSLRAPMRRGPSRRRAQVDGAYVETYDDGMHAIEFTTELGPEPILTIPKDIAAQLPKAGKARIIVLTADEEAGSDDAAWQLGAYEQFMREDAPEDAVYDNY